MTTLYKSVFILDASSEYYQKKVDLRFQNNTLLDIGLELLPMTKEKLVEGKDLIFVPGLTDLRVHNTLPGGEHREDWKSLSAAAKAGGVSVIQLLPTGKVAPQFAETIHFIKNIGSQLGVHFVPLAPLTIDNKGENFTDLNDLFVAGATGFSHGSTSLQHTDLFLKCLQYLMIKPVTVFAQPDTDGLSLYGQIHEGLQSTLTGLKGIPTLSETLAIKRDLDLLAYVMNHSFGNLHKDFSVHFFCLSSKESVELIRNAKVKGLPVTCSVAVHQLLFDESVVSGFDTNTKVFPPYRTAEDKDALIQGVLDGTIDVIVSDHHPIETELKDVEFDHASFGVIGIQTLLQAAFEPFKRKDYPKVVKALVENPNKLLRLPAKPLNQGQIVIGSILDMQAKSIFSLQDIKSLSKNSAFIGFPFKSSIINIFHL